MNDAGDVISNGRDGPGVYHAGQFYNLRDLSDPNLGAVRAINDNGQILGIDGTYSNGSPVLITIPQWAVKPAPAPVSECAPPGPPTQLRAVVAGRDVHVAWHAPAGTAEVTGYHVYRYTDPRELTHIADLDAATTSFVDTSPPAGAAH